MANGQLLLAQTRSLIYQALAEALASPAPDLPEILITAVVAGARHLDSAACRAAALALTNLPALSPAALEKRYQAVIVNPGGRPPALNESLHREGRLLGSFGWEVARIYRAMGLLPPAGELPDHASVELAYLSSLAATEAAAREIEDGHLVSQVKKAQRHFLRAHAGAWLPALGGMLAAAGEPFYAAVGQLLRAFLNEELAGRRQRRRHGGRQPVLEDPAGCTLCGLCVGNCPFQALQVQESVTQTALILNPVHCTGCARCSDGCPEGVLTLAGPDSFDEATDTPRLLRQSPRAGCPRCGRPTVSQAELAAVLARLGPAPEVAERLRLCVACKSGVI